MKKDEYLPKLPVIYISPEVKIKLDTYIQLAEGEISGLGSIEIFGKQDFLVRELYLFNQTCTPSDTKLDRKAVAKFIYQMIHEGKNPAVIKLWWHSHADMPVFWSVGTDEKTIAGFKNEWMVSIVGNKAGEYLGRVDIFKPIRLSVDKLELRVILVPDEEMRKLLAEEVTQKVVFTIPKEVPVNPKKATLNKKERNQ